MSPSYRHYMARSERCSQQNILLEKYYALPKGLLLPLPAYPVPNPKAGGLGIHLTPSVDGNVFIGPSNEYLDDPADYSATKETMDMLLSDAARIFPHIQREHFIRNFAGIRPKLTSKEQGGYHDFVIERREEAPNAINLVGIESPGLTSAVPISKYIVKLMEEVETLTPNPDFDPIRKGITTFHDKSPEEQAKLIAEDKIDLIAADVNSDGRVNAMDATRILRYAAKLITDLKK